MNIIQKEQTESRILLKYIKIFYAYYTYKCDIQQNRIKYITR